MRDRLDAAYQVGDHRTARALAQQILRDRPDDVELAQRARQVLRETEPDSFLAAVGALGLGLTAWLVYNYVL
jgi:hypothetical protein